MHGLSLFVNEPDFSTVTLHLHWWFHKERFTPFQEFIPNLQGVLPDISQICAFEILENFIFSWLKAIQMKQSKKRTSLPELLIVLL